MKKLFLSLIVAAVGALGCLAQDELVTLTHGSDLSTFSGENALAQACAAAEDGDVITLSPGVFVGCDIRKAVTLRGAGYKPMVSNNYVSTQITGEFTIYPPSGTASAFEMEGMELLNRMEIKGESQAPIKLSKCFFRGAVWGRGVNLNAHSCVFYSLEASTRSFNSGNVGYYNTLLRCNNCVIIDAKSEGMSSTKLARIIATNCIVNPVASSSNANTPLAVPYSTFINSIIVGEDNNSNNHPLPESCSAHHCIGINWYADGGTPDLFQDAWDPDNEMVEGAGQTAMATVFKSLKDLHVNHIRSSFELTDEAAAKYLGDDGTQMGVYGGNSQFNINLANPQVTKFTVSSAAENGQLKVKINVE